MNKVDEKQDNPPFIKDDVKIADMGNDYFSAQEYAVSAINWGEDVAQLRDELTIPRRASNS